MSKPHRGSTPTDPLDEREEGDEAQTLGDECEEFLAAFVPQLAPQPVSTPPPEPEESDFDPGDFFREPPPLDPPKDPEEAFVALRQKFPDAQEALLRQASASMVIVRALLVDKTDRRVDTLLARFLRQGGTITSNERAEIKGNGVEWSLCGDVGFTIDRASSREAGGFVYTLRLDVFGQTVRNQRDFLTEKGRRALFTRFNNQCNICESTNDLQADHRVAVVLVGGADHDLTAYQALCRPCNMNKRTACNKCALRDPNRCRDCSWAFPEHAQHTAGEPGVVVTLRLKPGANPADVRELLRRRGLLPT